MATPEEQKKRIQEIKAELNSLFARLDQADRTMLRGTINELGKGKDNLNEWERALKRFQTTADKVADSLDYISRSFTDAVNELQKQDKFLAKGKQAMNSIANTAQKALSIRRGETDINRKNLQDLRKKADLQKDILENAILQGQGTIAQNVAMEKAKNDIEEYKKGLDAVLETDRKIENSIGATASILKGVEKTLGKFGLPAIGIEEAFKETKRLGQAAAMAGKDFNAFGEFTEILKNNLKESLSPIKLLELGALAVGKAMLFIDKTSGNLAKNLGIANTEARGLVSEFNSLSSSSMNVFINTKNLSEAFGQLTQSLGVAKLASDAILESQVKLTKQAGYTNEAAVELAKLGAIQNTDAEGLLSNFLGQSEALNIQNGLQINSKQLAESALKTSKATLLQLKGQGQSLAEAAFEAKKLGLELQQIEGIADSLLNIESSIAAEFEAEVVLGRQLNLERARYYALTNDIAGLAGEIRKEAGSANEFAEMNRIEAEQLAKAFGMSREAMGEMLYEQEALSKLSGKANENAQTRFNNLVKEVGLERAKKELGNDTLANQLASANIQERFTAAIEKLQTLFLAIAEPLMPIVDIFSRVFGFVSGLVAKLAPVLKILTVIALVTRGIQLTFSLIGGAINIMNNGFGKATKLLAGMRAITNAILNTSKIQIAYDKMREGFAKRDLAITSSATIQKKIAIGLEKIGLINAKQLAYWKGRETFLGKEKNLQLATAQMYEKASLLSSIRKNIAEKAGNAIRKVKLVLEQETLGTLIAQNAQRLLANIREKALNVLKGIQLIYQKLEIANLIRSNALRAVAFFRSIGAMFVDVVKSFSKIPVIGTLVGAAVAAGLVAGAVALFNKKGNDVFSKPSGGSGYGDRMLLGPEGAISLNNKDTVIAGTNLFPSKKGDDVVSSPAGAVQMAPELDYNKLAAAIGGAVNNKQVTLSYTDFAQKTRPVFG